MQVTAVDGQTAAQLAPSKPMTITIQYKIYSDAQSKPQTVSVQRELADLINEAPPEMEDAAAATGSQAASAKPEASTSIDASVPIVAATAPTVVNQVGTQLTGQLDPATLPAIPILSTDPDPFKDTITVVTASGAKFDVPTVVTGGYDLDQLMCTFCNRTFKNDKTLLSHMLNHFGVTPKMAHCPVCGLTLQRKSYARHLRLHGNVIPEVCPFCQKEFREKRSLDKHIKAIHRADRPYSCEYCDEKFRNPVEQKVSLNAFRFVFQISNNSLRMAL
jgi:uncharacterized C2H2 Zn-finger protein